MTIIRETAAAVPWLLIAMFASPETRLEAQSETSMRPVPNLEDVTVRLQMVRDTYQREEAVRFRVTLRNAGSEALTLPANAAPAYVRIRLVDTAGNELKRARWPGPVVSLASFKVQPGEEVILTSTRGEQWMSLDEWGFELRDLGTFAIQSSIPLAGRKGAPTANLGAAQSNEVRFSIRDREQ